VGFIGAIGAAEARTIPKKLPIVAIETSKELPNAPIGEGPVLRVGDRMSVFTPDLTSWCGQVAQKLVGRRKSFKFQRRLMDGGTCESTAYVAYGYQATGLCLALGNYHNMNEKTGRLQSEYVSLADWRGLVDWFEALALEPDGFAATDSKSRVRGELAKSFRSRVELLATESRGRQAIRQCCDFRASRATCGGGGAPSARRGPEGSCLPPLPTTSAPRHSGKRYNGTATGHLGAGPAPAQVQRGVLDKARSSHGTR
jgi:hypothetical protein